MSDVLPNAENFETFDFAGDTQKKVTVEQCPDKSSTLTQVMEGTVSRKGDQPTNEPTKEPTNQPTNQPTTNLDADQMRVCACRDFLNDGVHHVYGLLNDHAGEVTTGDAKAAEEAVGVTNATATVADFATVCKQAGALKDWTLMAKMINHPTEVVPNFQAAGITGQEHCAKSWIVEGACAEIVKETSLLQGKVGNQMEKILSKKTKTTVTNDAGGNRKTETVTRDGNGNVVHSHTHVHNARTGQTETATRSKNHRHDHKHNSKSGQTETQTASKGHTHGHVTNAKTGVTATDSTGANGYQHHHDHTHTHQNGVTVTDTNSRTRAHTGAGLVIDEHTHVQNNNGATGTATTGTHGEHRFGNLR